ncbi:MAG: hypothetical protein U0798_18525 [Gemmataceae bacterium]
MQAALETLPWVESDSIKADKEIMQVRFAVTDPKLYDEAAVIEVITKKGYRGAKRLSGPSAD